MSCCWQEWLAWYGQSSPAGLSLSAAGVLSDNVRGSGLICACADLSCSSHRIGCGRGACILAASGCAASCGASSVVGACCLWCSMGVSCSACGRWGPGVACWNANGAAAMTKLCFVCWVARSLGWASLLRILLLSVDVLGAASPLQCKQSLFWSQEFSD
jgi:hypothetical protein